MSSWLHQSELKPRNTSESPSRKLGSPSTRVPIPKSLTLADKILGGGKFIPGYKRECFEGCTHVAVRGDMTDAKVEVGKEGTFKTTAEWFFWTKF